jgi:hypothetical protein
MKKFYLIAGTALIFTTTNLQALPFNVTYDFASVTTSSGTTDPTTVPTATGVTMGSFSAFGYSGNSSGAGRFSFAGNPTGSANGVNDFSTFNGSLNPSIYYSVTLTPMAGFTLNIDSISFTIQRSSTGIRNYAVRGSDDSFGANLSASISPANANLAADGNNSFQYSFDALTSAQNGNLISLGTAYDALTSATTFRFYGWNAEAGTGTFSIDNVNFVGSVAEPLSAPEKSSSFALEALVICACLAFGRKAHRLV